MRSMSCGREGLEELRGRLPSLAARSRSDSQRSRLPKRRSADGFSELPRHRSLYNDSAFTLRLRMEGRWPMVVRQPSGEHMLRARSQILVVIHHWIAAHLPRRRDRSALACRSADASMIAPTVRVAIYRRSREGSRRARQWQHRWTWQIWNISWKTNCADPVRPRSAKRPRHHVVAPDPLLRL